VVPAPLLLAKVAPVKPTPVDGPPSVPATPAPEELALVTATGPLPAVLECAAVPLEEL
jgi:hypothetical protein